MNRFAIALVITLGLLSSSASQAKDEFGDITVYSVSAREVKKDSIGNVYVSVKADVTNYGKKGKVFVTLSAKDSDGFELKSVLLPEAIMDTRDNREISTVTIFDQKVYSRIKEWSSKEARKY